MASNDEKCSNCKVKLTKLTKTPHGKSWRCGNCGAILQGPITTGGGSGTFTSTGYSGNSGGSGGSSGGEPGNDD